MTAPDYVEQKWPGLRERSPKVFSAVVGLQLYNPDLPADVETEPRQVSRLDAVGYAKWLRVHGKEVNPGFEEVRHGDL